VAEAAQSRGFRGQGVHNIFCGENCSESHVSVSCGYSSRVKKYLRIINSAISNFIPEKSKRQS
jgi:hypothetical protein